MFALGPHRAPWVCCPCPVWRALPRHDVCCWGQAHRVGRLAARRFGGPGIGRKRLCHKVLQWLPERSEKAAAFLHQLRNIAYQRGDYDDALEWYRKSLPIFEALGNRTGMASSLSQMGVLLTETGHPTEAIRLNLKSLALRRDLRLPEVRINLHWLDGQREALGQEAFQTALREHLSEEEADAALRLLDDQAAGDAG